MDPSGCGPGKWVVNLKVKPNKEWEELEKTASQALSESWEVIANEVQVSWQQSQSIRICQSRKREETQKRPTLLFTSGSHLIGWPGLKMRDQSRHVSRNRVGVWRLARIQQNRSTYSWECKEAGGQPKNWGRSQSWQILSVS